MKRLIIFPTDTVYGIGCRVFDKESIQKIYELKHRDRSKPLSCLCANVKQIEEIAYINEKEKKIVENFNITLILKAKENIVKITGFDTIGIRTPQSHVAVKILIKYGQMLTTSVNEADDPPLNTFKEVKNKFGKMVDKVYKSKQASSGVPSTVAKLVDGKVVILREGGVKKEQIKKFLSEI